MFRDSGVFHVGTWPLENSCRCVQWVKWPDVRGKVEALSKDLALHLNEFFNSAPATELPLLEYRYGDSIIENGAFHPPCDSRGCRDCGVVTELTGYSPVPLSLILQGCAEVYLECKWDFEDGRHVPLGVLSSGEMYGVFETLDHLLGLPARKIAWSVCSGVRSVWVIAPLGNAANIGQLLKDRLATWNDRQPHWQLIRAATKQAAWRTLVLLFPRKVVEILRSGSADGFFRILLQAGWTQSAGHRHSAVEDAELHQELRPRFRHESAPFVGELYQFATIKHWISVMKGDRPAFRGSHTFEEPGGPFPEFARALSAAQERAKLKSRYRPMILRPGFLRRAGDAGYYSFRCPSLLGPPMPEVRTYAELPDYFARVLHGIRESWAAALKPPHLQYYVQPPKKNGPGENGESRMDSPIFRYAHQLPLEDLAPEARAEELYWSSPFFVSGVRLCRPS
jgi:hypothetical protein